MIRKKKTKIGAPGDYAKFEIAVIKQLAKLLKQPYKKTAATINTDNALLKVISENFDKGVNVKETAKQLKAALIAKTEKAKTPAQAFIELLSKLPKKEQPKNAASFPMKLPATVTIGNNKHTDVKSHNVKINVLSGVNDLLNTFKSLQAQLKEAQRVYKKERDPLTKMYINAHRIAPLRYEIKRLQTEFKTLKNKL